MLCTNVTNVVTDLPKQNKIFIRHKFQLVLVGYHVMPVRWTYRLVMTQKGVETGRKIPEKQTNEFVSPFISVNT